MSSRHDVITEAEMEDENWESYQRKRETEADFQRSLSTYNPRSCLYISKLEREFLLNHQYINLFSMKEKICLFDLHDERCDNLKIEVCACVYP